jgi:dihydrofolate reductase
MMSRVRVHTFSVSIDGYGAGPHQDLDNPLGVGGPDLLKWFHSTKTFQKIYGGDGGGDPADEEFAVRGFSNIGAWILGRNMFGPIRGPWLDESWKGWWGEDPPYHTQVFVLTHHTRPSITMKGGTTFHFVTEGIHAALKRAIAAADGKDVRVGGGVETIRQYLSAGLIDEIHLAIAPILLGGGEHLLAGVDAVKLGYECSEHVPTSQVTHVVLTKRRYAAT